MHPIGVKLGSEKRPVGAGVGLAFKSRYFMISPGKPLHTRRGGGRVVRGGDACVAPAGGGGRHTRELDEGDANVPTPHAHRSHSYGTTPIGVNFSLSSRATARDRPYYTTDRLAKPVYSRGDPLRSPTPGCLELFRGSRGVYSRGDPLRSPSRTNLRVAHTRLQVDRQGQPYSRRPPITRVFDAQHRIV